MSESDPQEQDRPDDSLRQRILIGSQRDPAAYRARRTRDWIPLPESDSEPSAAEEPADSSAATTDGGAESAEPRGEPQPPEGQLPVEQQPPIDQTPATSEQAAAPAEQPAAEDAAEQQPALDQDVLAEIAAELEASAERAPSGHLPVPNVRDDLPADLEREFERAMSNASVDELLDATEAVTRQPILEPESQHTGRIVAVRRGDVFVELGSREQGIIPLEKLDEPPQPGAMLEVVVQRLNSEDGLYELTLPHAAVDVDDWADVHEGMLVDARITGHNTGGLECEVNHLRGFIPISQVSLYRVEDLGQFVGEKFACLVTEANPQRRNLVLSRRAVLEREQEEARDALLDSLKPGQVHEGVVRKLVDFGAFVELGSGVDGLLHISQLAWSRVGHPSEVLSEGQAIKVKIERVDRAKGKISLAYRDMLENPWDTAGVKYPPNTVVRGKVTNLMEFGAFVELEPGVEGLVHISELSHKHVVRTSDVVSKGEQVEVLVLSVDSDAQRISLSMKAVAPEPDPPKGRQGPEDDSVPKKPPKRKRPDVPLQGGLGRTSAGKQFGLKW